MKGSMPEFRDFGCRTGRIGALYRPDGRRPGLLFRRISTLRQLKAARRKIRASGDAAVQERGWPGGRLSRRAGGWLVEGVEEVLKAERNIQCFLRPCTNSSVCRTVSEMPASMLVLAWTWALR